MLLTTQASTNKKLEELLTIQEHIIAALMDRVDNAIKSQQTTKDGIKYIEANSLRMFLKRIKVETLNEMKKHTDIRRA